MTYVRPHIHIHSWCASAEMVSEPALNYNFVTVYMMNFAWIIFFYNMMKKMDPEQLNINFSKYIQNYFLTLIS